MTEATTCQSCHTSIYLLRHPRTGNTAPIEVAVSEKGNIAVQLDLGEYQIISKPARDPYLGLLHLNHYVTCPQAAAWHQYAKGGRP